MSRYATVETFIWHDEKFRALPEDARTVFLYLLTCPHGNMCGIFYLPDLYAASDLQWDAERYRKAIDTLCDTLLVAKDNDIIWIKNYLKHNSIKGPKQITGAVNRLMTLPDTKLIGSFMQHLEKHLLEDDVELFKELYTKPYEYPIDTPSDTLCDTPSIADTDTDTDTDTVSATASEAQAPAETPDDDDDDAKHFVSEVTKEFAVAFGYPPNQTQMQMLFSFLDDGLTDWHIFEALKRSAEAGASSPKYATAILQSWLTKKAFAKEDVERLDELRGPKGRPPDKIAREDFTYTEPQQDRSMFSFLNDKEDPA